MAKLFLWEIRKNITKKAIIGVTVAILAMLLLFAVGYNLINQLIQQLDTLDDEVMAEEGLEELDFSTKISKEELVFLIDEVKKEVAECEILYESDASYYNVLYNAKSTLVALEYAYNNGYYDKEVNILGYNYDVTLDVSGEGFASAYSAVVYLIVLIYGIILASNIYVNEYKSGTIKLVMARPITKNQLTLSKLLAVYAVLSVAYLVPTLIGYAYGGMAYGTVSSTQVIVCFNALSAHVSTVGALMFGEIMLSLVNIIVLATVSFALSTITRNNVVGFIATLLIALGVGSFLSMLGIEGFLLSTSLGMDAYFGVNTSVPRYGNFFIALAIVVFYYALSVASVFVITNKKDVY